MCSLTNQTGDIQETATPTKTIVLILYQISTPAGKMKRTATMRSKRKPNIFQKKCCNGEPTKYNYYFD
jgi:hypothetical protein